MNEEEKTERQQDGDTIENEATLRDTSEELNEEMGARKNSLIPVHFCFIKYT